MNMIVQTSLPQAAGGGSSTLAGVSVASTDTAKSLYTMTTSVNVEFEDATNATILCLDEATGAVGIGTDAPRTSLHIAAAPVTSAGNLMLKHPTGTGDTAFNYVTAWDSTENGTGTTGRLWWFGNGTVSESNFTINTDVAGSDIVLSPSGTERMRISSSAMLVTENIGVNTTDVSRTYGTDSAIIIEGSGHPGLVIRDTGQAQEYAIIAESNDFAIMYGTGRLVTCQNDGNVGIGTAAPTEMLDINSDSLRLRTAQTPASAGATGTQGQIAWDASYIYVCTATNTWKRVAIATW